MKRLFILFLFMSSAAQAWELPKIGVERHVQEAIQYNWVQQHSHKPGYRKVYIRGGVAAALAEPVDKSGEVYEHQKDKEFELAVRKL